MGGFTPEQQEILRALSNVQKTMTECLVMISERRANTKIAALALLLARRGLVTGGEFHEAVAEVEAGTAVEEALNPEIQAAWDEINRLFGETDKEEDKQQ